jgi:hypothetical protein
MLRVYRKGMLIAAYGVPTDLHFIYLFIYFLPSFFLYWPLLFFALCLNKLAQEVMFLICMRDVLGLNLGLDAEYPDWCFFICSIRPREF